MIDLHLHLDGSLSVKTVRLLAQKQNIALPESDTELKKLLSVSPSCRNLNEYLEKFDLPLSLLQNYEALKTAAYRLAEELKEAGVLYAEIRFAPQLHTRQGLSMNDAVIAVRDGLRQSSFSSNVILCCMRMKDNLEENLETVRLAHQYKMAVDLAGAESLYATESFFEVFSLAKELGVPFTIHAGEADGAASMKSAVSFGAVRIGHGVRSVEDNMLLAELREKKIVLELCPTSNLNTKVVDNLKEYPLRTLLDAGVRVTINTDNLTVSDTNLKKEWQQMISLFSLSEEEVKKMHLYAVDASFADEDVKNSLRNQILKADIYKILKG